LKSKESFKQDSDTSTRRAFLQTGVLGGIAAMVPLPGTPATRSGAGVPWDAPPAPPPFELDETTIADLQQGMAAGKLTARSIAERYLARIAAIDKAGPAINAVIQTNPDALSIADALDRERREKGPRGPLHGIPVLIKDNIDTADGMMTTAGSLALIGSKPPNDSFVARKLRAAGAVILGKTNLSEWANIRSGHSTSGWSGRGGLTRNPYALDRNPCGSSSGSGAGVSANLCAVAIGTETDGSIVCPSSANGVVGIKPTVGLISRSGIIPISHTQDTAGPMARTVRDAVTLLDALAGADPDDMATHVIQGKPKPAFERFLDPEGARGMRIGVVRKYFGYHDALDALIEKQLEALKKLGAIIVDPANIENTDKTGKNEDIVLLYELKADLNAYLARLGPSAPVHNLKEIIEFNERHRDQEMPYFGQDQFTKAEAKGPLTDKEYRDALETNLRLMRAEGIDAAMDKFKLDALVAPTAGPTCLTDLVNGDSFNGGASTAAAIAGYPHITVPAGFIFGLPVGISFFGRAWSEPTLIKIAYAYEQATKARKAPRFLPTADLAI
jgi:amidase